MSEADCLVTLDAFASQIHHGDFVDILALNALI
jgi:hypothetical protein